MGCAPIGGGAEFGSEYGPGGTKSVGDFGYYFGFFANLVPLHHFVCLAQTCCVLQNYWPALVCVLVVFQSVAVLNLALVTKPVDDFGSYTGFLPIWTHFYVSSASLRSVVSNKTIGRPLCVCWLCFNRWWSVILLSRSYPRHRWSSRLSKEHRWWSVIL
jgi:hypothetical protein